MSDEELLCSCCEKQKDKLYPTKSSLLGITLYMCQACKDNGYEPRWVIILAAREFGIKPVRKYIVNNLYEGDKIHASEVIA